MAVGERDENPVRVPAMEGAGIDGGGGTVVMFQCTGFGNSEVGCSLRGGGVKEIGNGILTAVAVLHCRKSNL